MSSIYNSSYEELLSNFDSYDEYLGEILKVEDKLWWNRASEKNTQMAYENYLLDYPNGIYKSKAKRKIDEFIAISKEKELERRRLEEVRLAEVARKDEEEKEELAKLKQIELDKIKHCNIIKWLLGLSSLGLFLFSIVYSVSFIMAILLILGHFFILHIMVENFIWLDEAKGLFIMGGVVIIDFLILSSLLPRITFGASLIFIFLYVVVENICPVSPPDTPYKYKF